MSSAVENIATSLSAHHGDPQDFSSTPFVRVRTSDFSQPMDNSKPSPTPFIPLMPYEKQYFPGQQKSLSGIAIRSLLLGIVGTSSVIATISLIYFTSSVLWRLPFFLSALSIFHFLEFWTTARYNTKEAKISSFLLSQNGSAYNIAHTAALSECLLTSIIFPNRSWAPSSATYALISVGLVMIFFGQTIRSVAMVQAGTNFNHIVQYRKANEHQLVTTGIYHYLRHPSYCGFFWWGLGTQLVLGNAICFVAYAVILWRFFSRRISGKFNTNASFNMTY
jgi:protein-S-isoprenylcysteine O-methyltransferase